jgi:hypothetical protein
MLAPLMLLLLKAGTKRNFTILSRFDQLSKMAKCPYGFFLCGLGDLAGKYGAGVVKCGRGVRIAGNGTEG